MASNLLKSSLRRELKKMVTFADDDWFRGMICSMVALGSILVGYAVYYGVLLPRWPDFDPEC